MEKRSDPTSTHTRYKTIFVFLGNRIKITTFPRTWRRSSRATFNASTSARGLSCPLVSSLHCSFWLLLLLLPFYANQKMLEGPTTCQLFVNTESLLNNAHLLLYYKLKRQWSKGDRLTHKAKYSHAHWAFKLSKLLPTTCVPDLCCYFVV